MLTTQVSKNLVFTSRRNFDERLGNCANIVKSLNDIEDLKSEIPVNKKAYVICGYSDDEGIKINNGRVGAAGGPTEIRRAFYKMTPSFTKKNIPDIYDIGNIVIDSDLVSRHELAKRLATTVLNQKQKYIALGGGHDYAYADGSALLNSCLKSKVKPLIINFDAHLDVRTLDRGLNSGTPFRRLLESYSDFNFAEIGIQEHCNNPSYYKWVIQRKGKIISNNEILEAGIKFLELVKKRLGPWLKKAPPTFLSIDIDAFASHSAMGASQSWPSGISPQMFFPVFNFLLKNCDVKVLGIYEVSPPLDFDNLTSKLAAEIIYRYINAN